MRRKAIKFIGVTVVVGFLLVLFALFPAWVSQVFGVGGPNLSKVCGILVTVGLALMFGLGPVGAWLVHKESKEFKGFSATTRYENN